MYRDESGWIAEYQRKGALWIHDGNPRRPHARLTSRNCSDGFFDSRPIIADQRLLQEAADDLCELLDIDLTRVDGVAGPKNGGTELARCMSSRISTLTGKPCFLVSPTKQGDGAERTMIFSASELPLLRDRAVLICDDVKSSGGSLEQTARAVSIAGGSVLTVMPTLVDRSGLEIDERGSIALIHRAMPMWKPEECPLCAAGSRALRPKDNWAALNAEY